MSGCPDSSGMVYRHIPKAGLDVSVIGMGTAQLRHIPEHDAVTVIQTALNLGINLIHTAPDYEGSDHLVRQALSRAKTNLKPVICSMGWGNADHLEKQLDQSCIRLGVDKIEIFGIASLHDREMLNEDMWGKHGAVRRLQELKDQGRIKGIFCSTHGPPEHLRNLLDRDAFDAVMLAYNPLGFHLLSFNPANILETSGGAQSNITWRFEDMSQHEAFIRAFHEKRVAVFVMKALAGGLLCCGKAFPPRYEFRQGVTMPSAQRVLRHVLEVNGVTSAIVGMASIGEVEENVNASVPSTLRSEEIGESTLPWHEWHAEICSRCGECDTTCSRQLKPSWLFRASYIDALGAESHETWDAVDYFGLLRNGTLPCSTCDNRSCSCPHGINIPNKLIALDGQMRRGLEAGWATNPRSLGSKPEQATLVSWGFNQAGSSLTLAIRNDTPFAWSKRNIKLRLLKGGVEFSMESFRANLAPGQRGHITVPLLNPERKAVCAELLHVRCLGLFRVVIARWKLEAEQSAP